jgi:hypothetical protein
MKNRYAGPTDSPKALQANFAAKLLLKCRLSKDSAFTKIHVNQRREAKNDVHCRVRMQLNSGGD